MSKCHIARGWLVCLAAWLVILPGRASGQDPLTDFARAGAMSVERRIAVEAVLLPRGGHLQGVQVRQMSGGGQQVLLTYDSEQVGHLFIVELPAGAKSVGKVVHSLQFPSDGKSPPLRHPGGFQLAGDVLAVGLEDNQDKTRSEVQFWNVAKATAPFQLKHLTLPRAGAPKDMTAGAVGLLAQDKQYLLAVANWDCRAIDFYRSNREALDNPACRFEHVVRWRLDKADKTNWQPDNAWNSYQAVQLLADAAGKVLLVGSATTLAGQDVLDLFAVEISQQGPRVLKKLATRKVSLPGKCHFQYAGAAAWSAGGWHVWASERNLHAETGLSIAP